MTGSSIPYRISDEVFALFPEYARGVVLATDVANQDSPSAVVSLLREAEKSLRQQATTDDLLQDPRLVTWRDAFRRFGTKPADYRPSIDALLRRVLKGQDLPTINTLVDLGNVVSLRHLVPVGGHALDTVTRGLDLRLAKGHESFVGFGSDQVETPYPGEIVFAEGDQVVTRRWTWRQAQHTLTLSGTRIIEFNVDGLIPVTVAKVSEICQELSTLIGQHCGGTLWFDILTADHPMTFLPVAPRPM